jgi:hypothetical protein
VNPKSRTDGLVIRQLGVDTMVMDQETTNVHCLNQLAFLVYSYADGNSTPEQIAERISETDAIPATTDSVELALEQLSKRGLLAETLPEPSEEQRIRRRAAIKQLATALAVPVILSMNSYKAFARETCETLFTPMGTRPSGSFSCTSTSDDFPLPPPMEEEGPG